MQGGWAGPLHLPTAAPGRRHRPIPTPTCGSGCVPTPPNTRAMGSGAPGRRCATTSAVRSTRRRCTGCGARRGCRCGSTARVNGPGCPRCPQVELPTPRRWCGRWISSSTPPLTARRSRSHRWSTNTPVSHCCIWWNARSPPSDSSPSSRRCSPRPAGHRRCCGWTTVRS